MLTPFQILKPNWSERGVKAYTILAQKEDGTSASFSLLTELGEQCRTELERLISPRKPICWLQQVHEDTMVELPLTMVADRPRADAAYTRQKGVVCAVLTADCIPVVFARKDGSAVAVVHAGRRGLEIGLLEKMVRQLGNPQDLKVWIGPGIGAASYPVSTEMRTYFLTLYPEWPFVFKAGASGQYHMDLYQIAKLQLTRSGVAAESISGAEWDTFTNPLLHSARRDGQESGRMATLVWLE